MNVNKTDVNFNGIYIIKGKKGKLKQCDLLIENKVFFNAQNKKGQKLYDYKSIYLLPKYDIPKTKLLVATNEDAPKLRAFLDKNYEPYNFISNVDEPFTIKEARAIVDLENPLKTNKRINPNLYLDMMLEKRKGIIHNPEEEAKQFVSHFAYTTDRKSSDIKEIKAVSFLMAALRKQIDFIEGIIESYKKGK